MTPRGTAIEDLAEKASTANPDRSRATSGRKRNAVEGASFNLAPPS
ncbi:MAG: hypothetical protein ABSD78_13880 [Acidimicrobiales bacterium]